MSQSIPRSSLNAKEVTLPFKYRITQHKTFLIFLHHII